MISNSRQVNILDILSRKGNVTVDELATELNVSRMTIRRDLEKLQENGLLQRTHGGALVNKVLLNEMTYHEKHKEHLFAKQKIAIETLKYIQPNSIIFLDAGTTTYEIALRLPREDLTIITNDIRIANHLMTTKNNVILLGGIVKKETGSIIDRYSQEMLKEFNIDLAIIGTSSIDNKLSLCTPDHERKLIKQLAIEQSDKKILVADSSKFFSKSLYNIASMCDFDVVITDLPLEKLEGYDLGTTEYVCVLVEEGMFNNDKGINSR